MKLPRPVATLALSLGMLLVLAAAMPIAGKDKGRKKKRFQSRDDLVVAFMPDEPLIAVAHWRDGRQYLTYPELQPGERTPSERERRFRSIVEQSQEAVDAYRVSESREWLAVRYRKGPLKVTNLDSGATALTVADRVSAVFAFHPSEDLLLLFQPTIGITRWDLGRGVRVEPTISGARTGVSYLEIAPSGNFARTEGLCEVDDRTYDYCIFDLRDGSAVGWADDLDDLSQLLVTDQDRERADEYRGLLRATGFIDRTQQEADQQARAAGCRRLDEDRLFCCSEATVAMTDERPETPGPTPRDPSGRKAMRLLGMSALEQRPREFPGRYLWQIAANRERKRLFINSCDLSADQKWVVLGVNSSEVLLFDTEDLDEASLALMGSWQQPALVATYEFP